ncbi:peptide ABC transporter ATP-binding protein [Siminovitchia terrae]|uniref:Peptide ABC transporter ATP-binding protein n=1 Tax=Siminovitchia terrae TaxID=1914933 RepID=A0ABQ4KT16_SIMTE|nr:dipeptide ABC transporter ATP-binding protein [Siminovitchia terrae]GIN94784.1 peptide ABC transporter ATP-binding protein [Siminovitchia terrae]
MPEQMKQTIEPLLHVEGLKTYFPIRSPLGKTVNYVKAVDNISFHLFDGETYGLVGESGCGKSTTGRTILQLIEPTGGELYYHGENIFKADIKRRRELTKELQMVFQDPYSSLNPKKRIGSALEEPLRIHEIGKSQKERTEIVLQLLHQVGLQEDYYYRFPHEFSGGQRQRIGLARALAVSPKVIICDEPVSALDVSIQSQVINLLQEVQQQRGLTYLFIAHDLSVVRHISDRVGVMYLGNLVEEAPTEELYSDPLHPYTRALMSAIPSPNPNVKKERIILKGEIPSPINPPSGCVFHPRCPVAMDRCKKEVPEKREISSKHFVTCHLI